ncbi:hypothetical protein COO60DRAFT_771390 [Scenedesmus sp. NREL 46B-D3]|nr:hypothetical protein COO60DRAFT_771390 [Scenedesmus sp. NREL 46B-D3]
MQQQQRTLNCRSSTAFYFVGLLAVSVYVNTLIGDFTFDDNFAVITNGDVTNNENPLSGLFKHDFWGQDIASSQSHKSYRPITILAFRLTRQAWDAVQLLVPGVNGMLPTPPQLPQQQQHQHQQQQQPQDAFSTKAPRPAGLHAFPFHVLSVALHAVVSMLVLALAQHLFAKLELAAGYADAQTDSSSHAASTAGPVHASQGGRSSSSLLGGLLMWQHQPGLWLKPVTWAGQAQALTAAGLFALHPAHTEAVAGVVGCAELICAAWSIPALLLYFMAVDGRYVAAAALQQQQHGVSRAQASSNRPGSTPKPKRGRVAAAGAAAEAGAAAAALQRGMAKLHVAAAAQHWLLVLASAGLAVLAALSKEIGITITGTMVLYDLLLAPHMLQSRGTSNSADSQQTPTRDKQQQQQQQQHRGACRKQLVRVLLLAVVTVGYIKLRSWVAVQQLVDIYRKVENPIPFAASFSTRFLSIGYLHARYFGILLLPLHLSADWSFSCIPLVEQLSDPRNAATAALYLYFLYVCLSAQPLQLLRQLWGAVKGAALRPAAVDAGDLAAAGVSDGSSRLGVEGSSSVTAAAGPAPAAGGRLGHARWRLVVLMGLLVAPFFPASNVLFYVGTFIGERLLYFPSVGFCLLAADLTGWLLQPSNAEQGPASVQQQRQQQSQSNSGSDATTSCPTAVGDGGAADDAADSGVTAPAPSISNSDRTNTQRNSAGAVLAVVLVLAVCCGYALRTLLRNADWWDEERLFIAAQQVCPNSAKVQQNSGVLQRRYSNFTAAMKHFKRAQKIEPGYCEPSYWIALTRINQGEVLAGVAGMKASLGCKYTAAEALQTLNRLYVMMHENTPGDPMPMLEWAGVLLSPDVLRVADGCTTAEDAALLAAVAGKSSNYITQALDVCLQGLQHWEAGDTPPDTLASLARERYSSLNTTLLRQCVGLRRAVYRKLAAASPKSQAAKKALYKVAGTSGRCSSSSQAAGCWQVAATHHSMHRRAPPSHQHTRSCCTGSSQPTRTTPGCSWSGA